MIHNIRDVYNMHIIYLYIINFFFFFNFITVYFSIHDKNERIQYNFEFGDLFSS